MSFIIVGCGNPGERLQGLCVRPILRQFGTPVEILLLDDRMRTLRQFALDDFPVGDRDQRAWHWRIEENPAG
jgi:hypothetical protein